MAHRLRVSVALWPVAAGLVFVSPAAAQRAPAPAAVHLPTEVVSLACAPSVVFEVPPTPLRITGSQEAVVHRTFAQGDLITVNAGIENGIEVGQEYYTRRLVPIEKRTIGRDNPATIRTSGWIRIYAVDRQMSLATVVHSCDAIELNDYLEPFALPAVPAPSPNRPAAQRSNYGRVLIGDDNRTAFGKGDYVVVDRGSDHGVSVGAHFVVYRDKQESGNFLFEIAEAFAINVKPDTSTLRVTLTRDGIIAGDLVAIRK